MKLPTSQSPSLENIYQAAQIIGARASPTPCRYSRQLSDMTGATVILKYGNLQFTGSFNGLDHLLSRLISDRKIPSKIY